MAILVAIVVALVSDSTLECFEELIEKMMNVLKLKKKTKEALGIGGFLQPSKVQTLRK